MGKLRLLELENFKSYAGKTSVGPFDDFTCVIGPNGAGKSNLMDAISFVLGVQSRHLRSSTLKELLYRKDADAIPARRASVKLIYQVSEGELENESAGSDVMFMRLISATGVSTYRLNDQDVTFEVYEKQLQKIGVLVRARNFLVFQGDVESIASKNPQELTKLLEQIAGSDALLSQFEELERKKKEAEEATLFSLSKKKMYNSQKKEVKDQKEEADEYQTKQEELSAVKTQQVVMKLWSGKKQATAHLGAVNKCKGELEGMGEEAELVGELQASKRELAQNSKALAGAERDHLAKFKTMSSTASKLEETQAKVRGLHKRAADLKKALGVVQGDHKVQKDKSKGLETQIKDAEKAKASLQADLDELAAKGFHLDDTKLKEYNRLREELAALNAGDLAREGIVDQEVRSKEMQVTRLQAQINTIRGEQASSENMLDDHTKRIAMLQGAVKTTKTSIAAAKTEREGAVKAIEEGGKKAEALEKDLEAVKAKLADSGEQRSRSKREEKIDAAIDSMQRIFTGVHGKLHDLCKPIQRKYQQAIAVTAGKHMNAVVVDNASVAQECIRYLKDQRAGTCVFLPLSTIDYKPVPERLRQYAPRYKMCIDLLECEDRYKPAVSYAVGSAMVCETLAEAQELAFSHNERVKVVTIGGAVIGKSGAMTGGTVERQGENKFAEKEIDQLRSRRLDLEEALAECRRGIPIRQQMIDLEIRTKSLQTRLAFTEADCKVTESKKKEMETNNRLKMALVKDLEKEISEASKVITTLTKELTALRTKLANTERGVFGAFSASIGVDNIREYERRYLREHSDLIKRRDAASDHLAALRAQLEYQKKRDFTAAESRLTTQIEEAQSLAAELEEEMRSLLAEENAHRSATRAAEDKVVNLRHKVTGGSKAIKDLQLRVGEQLQARSAKATQLAKEEIQLERCKKELREVMMSAQMDEVHLPADRVEDSVQAQIDSESGGMGGGSATVSQSQTDIELRVTMTEALSSQTASQPRSSSSSSSSRGSSSGGRSSKETAARDTVLSNLSMSLDTELVTYTAIVDLSAMDRKLRGMTPAAIDEMRVSLSTQVIELTAEVAEMRPNMHASDRLDSVSAKLKEIETELESSREKARSYGTQFENCRNERIRLFETCYTHVSKSLSIIYKDLTRSSKQPEGGTAFLTLDDQNEPYSGGTRYTAMPPLKRFRDMEQLSGGEKTMAALALLFSIHSFRQAPFFVLDEVDAALDNVNVKKICNYIRQRSKEFQCIVISLKDTLFEHADSLVGVAKDVGQMSSKVYTLDLKAFDAMNISSDREVSRSAITADDSTRVEEGVSGVDITTTTVKSRASGRASPTGSSVSGASSATVVRASPKGSPTPISKGRGKGADKRKHAA